VVTLRLGDSAQLEPYAGADLDGQPNSDQLFDQGKVYCLVDFKNWKFGLFKGEIVLR